MVNCCQWRFSEQKKKKPCDAALTRAWLHCCSSWVNCWKTASPSILPSVWLASSANNNNNNNKSIQTNVREKCVTDEIGDGVQCPHAHAHRLMTCQRHETGFGVRFDQRGATDGVCWQTNDEWGEDDEVIGVRLASAHTASRASTTTRTSVCVNNDAR